MSQGAVALVQTQAPGLIDERLWEGQGKGEGNFELHASIDDSRKSLYAILTVGKYISWPASFTRVSELE